MKLHTEDIPVTWEMEFEIDKGDTPKRQRVLAAMLQALCVLRDPAHIATVFKSGKHEIDLQALDNFEARRALSFNGDLWFWTLTRKESVRCNDERAQRRLLRKLTPYVQTIADKYEMKIAIQTECGIELLVVWPNGITKKGKQK
ncbi:MAG: hypothetical protein WC107_07470 [Patescibacteria group bacterium]